MSHICLIITFSTQRWLYNVLNLLTKLVYARFTSSVCWYTPGLHHRFVGIRQVYIIGLLVYARLTSSVCWYTPCLHHRFVGIRQVYIIGLLVYARFTSSVCNTLSHFSCLKLSISNNSLPSFTFNTHLNVPYFCLSIS